MQLFCIVTIYNPVPQMKEGKQRNKTKSKKEKKEKSKYIASNEKRLYIFLLNIFPVQSCICTGQRSQIASV